MNILLWASQIFLALHTLMGAIWKFSNSEQAVQSLAAIPHAVWISMIFVEILCSVSLVLPAFRKPLGFAVPIAAAVIAAEMLLFCVVHLSSGVTNHGELIYWILVAAFCAFIAHGRLKLKPFSPETAT